MFNVYIDESGDEGFTIKDGKWVSTKWFIIGALLVHEEHDRELAHVINEIKANLNFKPEMIHQPLHFTRLNHKKRRMAVHSICDKGNFNIIVTGMYKPSLKRNNFFKKGNQYLYNYQCRFLLERISWFVQERKAQARLIFEHRSNVSHDDLNKYILSLLERTDCEINKNAFLSWEVLNKNQSKNLQVADSINGAAFAALEEDEYGFVEPTYIQMLSKFFYRRGRNLASYGLKLFPLSCNDPKMHQTYPWLKGF